MSLMMISEAQAQGSGGILWARGPELSGQTTSLVASRSNGLVLGAGSGSIQSWPIDRTQLPQTFQYPDGGVYCASLSHDGELICGLGNGHIAAWNPTTNQLTDIFSLGSHTIWNIDVSPDGKLIAAYTVNDWLLHLYDRTVNKEVATWPDAHGPVRFSPDGKVLLASLGSSLVAIDLDSKTIVHHYSNIVNTPWDIQFNPVKPDVFAAVDNYLWVMDTLGNVLAKVSNGVGNTIAYSPDGSLIAAATGDITIVRPSDGSIFQIKTQSNVEFVSFLDNDTVAAADVSDADLYSVKGAIFLGTLSAGEGARRGLQFSKDGNRLLSGDGMLRLWDAEEGMVIATNSHASSPFVASADLGTIVATGSGGLSVFSGVAGNGRPVTIDTSFFNFTGDLILDFSPSDSMFAGSFALYEPDTAYPDESQTIYLWSSIDGSVIRELGGPLYPVTALAFSRDGSEVAATYHGTGVTCVWDTHDGRLLDSSVAGDSAIMWIQTILPGTNQAAEINPSWEIDSVVRVVDLATDKVRRSFPVPGKLLRSIAVNPRTGELATGCDDGTIIVWKSFDNLSVSQAPVTPASNFNAFATSNHISIRLTASQLHSRIMVYSIDGRYVYSSEVQGLSVETGPLANGVYFVVLVNALGERAFRKVSIIE